VSLVSQGRDGWGVLWAQQLLHQGGLAALVLLQLRARASFGIENFTTV
jgi:hypothetical protein